MKPLEQCAARPVRGKRSTKGMPGGALERGFDSGLESDAGARPRLRVVLDFVEQLGLRLRQEPDGDHFAIVRALAKTSSAESAITSPRS